jgi:cysteine desulfurase / selenocysteine lyase
MLMLPQQKGIDVVSLRAETGVSGSLTYLNNARVSPCPRPALQAVAKALESEYREGWKDGQANSVMANVRVALAQLINAAPEEISIIQSASYGINVIVNGLDWRKGDNVIVYDLAYRSVAQALMRLRDEKEIELRFVDTEDLLLDPAAVIAALDDRTRLVVVDQLPVFCGVPQPVAEIGKLLADSPALFAVNATQSVGQLPIDVKGFCCDFLFGTSRKWLRGPRGLGFLYVNQPLIAKLRPTNLGYPAGRWIDFEEYEIASDIDRLHLGDYPYALLVGLTESVRYARRIGIENIAERNRMLGAQCRQALSQVPGLQLYDSKQGLTGTVPFNLRGVDAVGTVKGLLKDGIVTCVINEADALLGLRKLNQLRMVRASLHYFNSENDVEHLARALTIIGQLSPSAEAR